MLLSKLRRWGRKRTSSTQKKSNKFYGIKRAQSYTYIYTNMRRIWLQSHTMPAKKKQFNKNNIITSSIVFETALEHSKAVRSTMANVMHFIYFLFRTHIRFVCHWMVPFGLNLSVVWIWCLRSLVRKKRSKDGGDLVAVCNTCAHYSAG